MKLHMLPYWSSHLCHRGKSGDMSVPCSSWSPVCHLSQWWCYRMSFPYSLKKYSLLDIEAPNRFTPGLKELCALSWQGFPIVFYCFAVVRIHLALHMPS